MPEKSAGLLLYRRVGFGPSAVEVLLVHPGGPFWARKDAAAWSMPKGVMTAGEEPLATARREFAEETGSTPPATPPTLLGEFRQGSGKVVVAYAVEADFDVRKFHSNTFTMEWPPRSGRMVEFPEADKAAWFELGDAAVKIHKGQVPILAALAATLETTAATRR